ncbi:hypothetical protein [Nocardia sp. NPDC050406]|uniref:hypothetical protein n=1 Tax=Nocardia sp. NPDC050406 TaxID=3364318 RepID=UPI0037AA7115
MVNQNIVRAGHTTNRFGSLSMVAAASALSINVFPLTLVPSLVFLLSILYLVELVVTVILWFAGGRSRQVGSGLAVALVGTALCVAMAVAASQI